MFSLEKLNNIIQFERTIHVYKIKIFLETLLIKLEIRLFYKYLLKLQTKEILQLKDDFIFFKTHSGLFEIGS